MDKLKEVKKYIEQANTICLVAHTRPDGDAIGSVGAMYYLLKEMNKEVYMVLPNLSSKYNFLPGIDTYVEEVPFETYDLLICLDTSDDRRLNISPLGIKKAKNKIVIDHHKNNSIQADLKLIDENSPANCELVYRVIKYMGHKFSTNIASYIYMGIMTDTGSLNYERTTGETYRIAGEMVDTGIDFTKICKIMNDTHSEMKMKLVAHLINNMEVYVEGKIRVGVVDKNLIDNLQAVEEDVEGIVNYLRSIENTVVAVYIRAIDEKAYKVSIRAGEPIDAAEVAKNFGGGGHKRAAGFETEDLANTKEELIKMLEGLLKSENNGNT